MQENKKRESLESLREELKWYTLYASDEEYDEKAVESIMYLLDRWEPLEEGTVPPVEESWKRFLKVAGGKELLPLGDVEAEQKPASKDGVAVGQKPAGKGGEAIVQKLVGKNGAVTAQELVCGEVVAERDSEDEVSLIEGVGEDKSKNIKEGMAENIVQMLPEEDENSGVAGTGKQGGHKKAGKLAKFASRHKIIAAAVLVLMVLMVGNTIHAVANPETGFFFWLDRDDSGVKMMTSPEELDGVTNKQENIFYKRDEVPEWAQEWLQIEAEIEVEIQDTYELKYFEASESDKRRHIASNYSCENMNKEIVVGVWIYWDQVSYFREGFVGYDYVQSYELAQKEIDIYKKMENTGKVYYIACFYEDNCQYYVRGQENLEELKELIEKCWKCVQNNS